MSDTPEPKVRGFVCPNCVGVRLFVYRTRRPARGRVVRYRECSACGHREVTEEVFARVLAPRKIEVQDCTTDSTSATS